MPLLGWRRTTPHSRTALKMAASLLAIASSLVAATPVPLLELGAYDISTSETTAFLWHSDLLIVEKMAGSAVTIWSDGDACKRGNVRLLPAGGGEYDG